MLTGQYPAKLNTYDPTLSVTRRKGGRREVDGQEDAKVVRTFAPIYLCDEAGKPTLVPYVFDTSHPHNQVACALHRAGRKLPEGEEPVLKDFVAYAKKFIITHFEPLEDRELVDFNEWLEKSNYSPAQKLRLRGIRAAGLKHGKQIDHIDGFLKNEMYMKFDTQPRGIFAAGDESKVLLGPLIHSIDHKVMMTSRLSKFFMKGKDPMLRPEILMKAFGLRPVMGTDFSSFEAHHRKQLMEVGRFWIMHMARNLNNDRMSNATRRVIARMLSGVNIVQFRDIEIELVECLMSGAMWTSSLNGVLNLLIMSYLTMRSKEPDTAIEELAVRAFEEFNGFVEGDDGIAETGIVNEALIKGLGIILKFDYFPNFGEASFCGIVCDEEAMVNLSDPKKFLAKVFTLDAKYEDARDSIKLGLLRAFALSTKYALNNCPIIGPIAHHICTLTASVDATCRSSEMDMWQRNLLKSATEKKVWKMEPDVSYLSRIKVEKIFRISVADQLRIEREFCAVKRIGPVEIDLSCMLDDGNIYHAREFVVMGKSRIINLPQSHLHSEIVSAWIDGIEGERDSRHSAYCAKVTENYRKCEEPIHADIAALEYEAATV